MSEPYSRSRNIAAAKTRERRITTPLTYALSDLKQFYGDDLTYALLFGISPIVDRYGPKMPNINGVRVHIPDRIFRETGRKGKIIDFSDTTKTGLSNETLLTIAASLQGAGETISMSGLTIPTQLLPIAFSENLAGRFKTWIASAGEGARKMVWDEKKLEFYQGLQSLLHQAFRSKAFNPSALFAYCLSSEPTSNPQHRRGIGIFSAFFPQFSEILNISTSKKIVEGIANPFLAHTIKNLFQTNGVEIRMSDIVLELIKTWQKDRSIQLSLADIVDSTMAFAQLMEHQTDKYKDLTVELKFLRSEKPPELSEIQETKSRMPRKRRTRVPDADVYGDINVKKITKDVGLRLDERDQREAEMLRNYYNRRDAVVISPEQIRQYPERFLRLQYAILQEIAEVLLKKRGIDIDGPLPFPPMPSTAVIADQEATFRRHEALLRKLNRFLLVLLTKEGQDAFFNLMPFTRVPPYVDVHGEAIPINSEKQSSGLSEFVGDDQSKIVNTLPFLNYVFKNQGLFHSYPTIPGSLFRNILQSHGKVLIVHGTARWVVDKWGEQYKVDPKGYIAYDSDQKSKYPNLDIDVLAYVPSDKNGPTVAGITKSLCDKINEKFGKYGGGGLISSYIIASSMNGKQYIFISKAPPSNIHPSDSYAVAHESSNIVQTFLPWSGGEAAEGQTYQLIETLLTLSTFRGIGLVPQWLDGKGGKGFAVKAVDIFGGLVGHVEGGGGVMVNGAQRDAIRFLDLDEAFPRGQSMSIWHLLRTLTDIIHTKNGGVFMPTGIARKYEYGKDYWVEAFKGSRDMRERVLLLNRNREDIIKRLERAKAEDFSTEMMKVKQLIDADPLTMMILFSGKELDDLSRSEEYLDRTIKKRGVYGIELSNFYPNIHVLRENKNVWMAILKKINGGQQTEGESGSHFLARMILDTQGATEVIVTQLRRDFFLHPMLLGNKFLVLPQNEKKMNFEGWDWMTLDPDGIGPWAFNTKLWSTILRHITRNYVKIKSISEMQRIAEEALGYKEDMKDLEDKRQSLKRNIEQRRELLRNDSQIERRIDAFVHWLIYPGFDDWRIK